MPRFDDTPLNRFEWRDFIEELQEFDVRRPKRGGIADFYPILLHDAVVLFDKNYWDAALPLNDSGLSWE